MQDLKFNATVNPRNWSITAKVYHTYIPSIVGFLVCFASTSTVPAETELQNQFNVSARVSLLSFTLFILGLAFGPVAAAPISEKLGRRPVYLLSIPLFSLFLVGTGFSKSFAVLIFCRFIAGLFGGSSLVVGFGLLADIWDSSELPLALSIFNTVPFCGPAAGQLVSSYIVPYKSWPWTQWVTLFLAVFTFVTVLPIRETHRVSKVKTAQDPKLSIGQKIRAILATIPLLRPLHMLFKEPVVLLFSLYVAFNFTVVYCFSASIPYTFKKQYDFSIQSQGLVFIGLIVGYIFSAPTMVIPYLSQMRQYQKDTSSEFSLEADQHPPPERLLWPALLGSLALPISFFWFGWSAYVRAHWIVPIFALGLFSWGNNLLYNAAQLYLLETYGPKYGASATAANNLLRYALATILPLFQTDIYAGLGINWAASLFGFILVLLLPIPWALRHFGPQLRARSKYLQPSGSTIDVHSNDSTPSLQSIKPKLDSSEKADDQDNKN